MMKNAFLGVVLVAVFAAISIQARGQPATPPPFDDGNWYFCPKSGVYYPWVGGCDVPWRPVLATPGVALPPSATEPPMWRYPPYQKMWDDDIARLSAEYLANVQAVRSARQAQKDREEADQKAAAARKIDERNGFKFLSVSDFELDKRTLSPKLKLVIWGFYETAGNLEWLAAIGHLETSPKIPLITDQAPRDVRATLLRCRTSSGCGATLVGHVGSCEHLFLGAAYKADRCLYVDGIRY